MKILGFIISFVSGFIIVGLATVIVSILGMAFYLTLKLLVRTIFHVELP